MNLINQITKLAEDLELADDEKKSGKLYKVFKSASNRATSSYKEWTMMEKTVEKDLASDFPILADRIKRAGKSVREVMDAFEKYDKTFK